MGNGRQTVQERLAIAEQINTTQIIASLDGDCTQKKKRVLETIIPAHLKDYEEKELLAVLFQYAHIFATNPNDLGRTNVLSHRIDTKGTPI